MGTPTSTRAAVGARKVSQRQLERMQKFSQSSLRKHRHHTRHVRRPPTRSRAASALCRSSCRPASAPSVNERHLESLAVPRAPVGPPSAPLRRSSCRTRSGSSIEFLCVSFSCCRRSTTRCSSAFRFSCGVWKRSFGATLEATPTGATAAFGRRCRRRRAAK